MPKKTVYSKDVIYKKAFDLFKLEGIEGITARNLAKFLGSSPVPIYSIYSSIDELKKELLEDAKKLFMEYIHRNDTFSIFLNIGMGICIFARDEKEIFQTIFLRSGSSKKNEVIREFRDMIREEIKKDNRFAKLDEEYKLKLFLDCWMYAHGLATLIATNYFEEISDEFIKERLMEGAATMLYKRLESHK